MAKSNKALFWGLFAAGGTVVAFLTPVLVLVFLLAALGHVPTRFDYDVLHGFVANYLGKLILFGVIALSLWHCAHRLRCVLHDFGLRIDTVAAWVLYLAAAAGTVATAWFLLLIC
jgi:fumarate reductase subunit D